jgi:hypothetical protein
MNKITSLVEKPEIVYDVTGNDFDIALVNEGVPECWTRIETHEVQSGRGTKVLRMTFNAFVSSGITPEVMIARGAAICALIESLEYAGFRIELQLYQRGSYTGGTRSHCIFVPIKYADGPLDLDHLAFCLAHPSMFRRLCFAINEHDKDYMKGCMSYGLPANVDTVLRGDINIDCASFADAQWSNPTSAVKWILAQMKEQGVEISEEVPA